MGIKTVPQPPYSPDLAPCDFCLFPKLRSCRYETIEKMKEAVTKVIDTLTQKDFDGAFQKLLEQSCEVTLATPQANFTLSSPVANVVFTLIMISQTCWIPSFFVIKLSRITCRLLRNDLKNINLQFIAVIRSCKCYKYVHSERFPRPKFSPVSEMIVLLRYHTDTAPSWISIGVTLRKVQEGPRCFQKSLFSNCNILHSRQPKRERKIDWKNESCHLKR